MDLENTYYKRIIYKKNAFDDLKTYLKINYSGKNVFVVTSGLVMQEDVTSLLNALFCASEGVVHFAEKNGFNSEEVEKLNKKLSMGKFHILVCFGGGKCCDVVKYFAFKYNLPYVVCPAGATSLAYFSPYCINPIDSTQSFVAKMPSRIFINESIIKKSNLISNINGLCFLHSFRVVLLENMISDKEKERYVYLGLEKLFNKLDIEQTNILICDEDSNLILMDLMIDFGFFINMLSFDNYLISSYNVLNSINEIKGFSGNKMLLLSKVILSTIRNYLELNMFNYYEMPNYEKISKCIEKYKIFNKKLKNNCYFTNILNKSYIKKDLINNRECLYNEVCLQILKIKNFIKLVKNIYKGGIELDIMFKDVMLAVGLSPFINGENKLFDFMSGSGILNCYIG